MMGQEWTSVKDRLPENDGKYVVPFIGIAWYDPNFGWSLLLKPFIEAITHWMPLPDLPIEAGAIYQDC